MTYYWFVYRRGFGQKVDTRCPTGAVCVTGPSRTLALEHAWAKAEMRYPFKPRQHLLLCEAITDEGRRHVEMLEAAWEREYLEFRSLMLA